MYSFIICVVALILGYVVYGSFVERVFKPDGNRQTPAIMKEDGMDYVPLPSWKLYTIQFLNIAGTGPVFGAIMGARFGPACFIWIVFGCIFGGAVHDYLSGMISMRHNGVGLPGIIGVYGGKSLRNVMLAITVILLILVGGVFVYSPAVILNDMTGSTSDLTMLIWAAVIFIYYIIATLMPIDKIIGKIYPLFAIALIFMAAAMFVGLFVHWPSIPELWHGLSNRGPELGIQDQPIFPCMFVTIACGAVSGFHATQSPMVGRCMSNEKLGRPIFYGAMITEGLVALIWAAVASYFFFDGGAAELGSSIGAPTPHIVTVLAKSWLGAFGGILALLGVVVAPITTGDTALRSARMILADFFHLEQSSNKNKLLISIPLFVLVFLVLLYNILDQNGFNTIWQYFGWLNQILSIFTFWALTTYIARHHGGLYFLITEIPGMFMTAVCSSYIFHAKFGFGLPVYLSVAIGTVVACLLAVYFHWRVVARRNPKRYAH